MVLNEQKQENIKADIDDKRSLKERLREQTEGLKKAGKVTGQTIVESMPIIGETIAASPAVVEHVIRGWTGGLGKHAMDLMDKALVKSGLSPDFVEPTPAYLTNIPLIKAFVTRYPSMNTKPIERFYKEYNKRERVINTYKKLLIFKTFYLTLNQSVNMDH